MDAFHSSLGTDVMGTTARKLLLVEADPNKREHMLSLFRQPALASFEVDICTQPREAVHRLGQNVFFACLLPNDLSLLQDIRRVAVDTLCILISEGGDAQGDSRAIEQGADDVLVRTSIDADQVDRALLHGQLRRDSGSKLERQAKQDPLTGLGNRARLEEELDRLLIQGKRSASAFALLYIDLDYFK